MYKSCYKYMIYIGSSIRSLFWLLLINSTNYRNVPTTLSSKKRFYQF